MSQSGWPEKTWLVHMELDFNLGLCFSALCTTLWFGARLREGEVNSGVWDATWGTADPQVSGSQGKVASNSLKNFSK